MREDVETLMVSELVRLGYSVDYGRITMGIVKGFWRDFYQVHCDNHKYPESKLFNTTETGLESAVELFFEIKKELSKNESRNSKSGN